MKTIILFCCLLLVSTAHAAASGYHLINKLKVGGEGSWDYLTIDGEARRLYVARGTHVMVINLDTGQVAGDIPNTPGVHGVAIAREANRGFTSNGQADTSTIFDLTTLKALGKVKTGGNPDAIVFDFVSNRVFTLNGRSKDATAFDAVSGKVVKTIPLGGKPEFAAADGKGKVYVNIEDTNEVAEIDTINGEVTRRFSIKPCHEPTGLALDVERGRVYSVCHNKLMTVLDLRTGKLVETIPIGAYVDGAAYDEITGLIFSSNGEGTLTVARESSPGKFEVVETVPTQRGARTMAIDPVTHNIYLATAEFTSAPASAAGGSKRRPEMVKGSFEILVLGK